MRQIKLVHLRIDGGTQSRVELDPATVDDYAEVLRSGGKLPPVTVFYDGGDMWLADGFHRYHAHLAAEATEIDCEVHEGTQRDAILHSVHANANHGLRRTNEDKRKAITTLVDDVEWGTWADRKIAEACGVSHSFVAAIRRPEVANKQQANRDKSAAKRTPAVESDSTAPGWPFASAADRAVDAAAHAQADAPSVATPPDRADAAPSAVVIAAVPPADVLALQTQLAELAEAHAELQGAIKEALAENELMGRICDAEDKIAAALAEARRYKALADNAERSLAAKTGEFIERAHAVTYWKNQAEKAEKALEKARAA